jgi:hypothetical protein
MDRHDPSGLRSIGEVNNAVVESAFVDQLELHMNMVGEGPVAASHYNRIDEKVVLVDQAGFDRLRREVGTAHADVTFCPRL